MSGDRPAGYRHGLRVRMGSATGPRGVLLECESRAGKKFWRVRLQGLGVWCWPNERGGIVVDGVGDAIAECRQCELRFIHTTGDGELICARCDAETFGTAVRGDEGEAHPFKKRYEDRSHRRRWIPSKRGRR